MSYDWLNNLKVGDKVIYHPRLECYPPQVTTVSRATKTQIRVEAASGVVFNRSYGRETGTTGWRHAYIHEASPENLASLEADAQRKAEDKARADLSRQIVAALKGQPSTVLRTVLDLLTRIPSDGPTPPPTDGV